MHYLCTINFACMNKHFPVVVALIFTIFFSGCGGNKKASDHTSDSTATASASTGTVADIAITGRLAELGLTNDTDWRGINLGDDFAKVKTTEKGESFESDAKHVGYTVEFQNLETADMLYYQANQKVSAIDVDLFLNSRQSVTDYQKELEPYFTSRYGSPKKQGDGTIWSVSNSKIVTLKDVSKGKDFGLKVKIESTAGTTTASVK